MVTSARARTRGHQIPVEGNCWVSIWPAGRRHDGFMGNDERMRAQPSVDSGLTTHPFSTPCLPTRPVPVTAATPASGRGALQLSACSTADLGSAVARTRLRREGRRGKPTSPANRWTPGLVRPRRPAGFGDRLRHGNFDARHGPVRARLDVIAVEVYRRGLASCSAHRRENVTNIRLIRGDAVDVLEHLITSGSLSGVRVFFPDPWPKARHHKRRLLQPATVALIADRLRPGGILHAATDHPGYAEQIAEVGDAEPLLAAARSRTRELAISGASARRPNTRARPATPAAPSPSCSGKDADHEPDRRDDRSGHRSPPGGAGARAQRPDDRRVLLVWDAPNLDMGLGRSWAAGRPRWNGRASTRWAAGCWPAPPRSRPIGTRFGRARGHGLHQHRAGQRRCRPPVGRCAAQRRFAVFAKPKLDEDSDVDSDMLDAHRPAPRRGWRAVVASADGQAFRSRSRIARTGYPSRCSDFANTRVGR